MMRSCHFSRPGLAAFTMAAWVILASWPCWSIGQDNPLRSSPVSKASAKAQSATEVQEAAATSKNSEPDVVAHEPSVVNTDPVAIEERHLAERIASICSQPFGPWMQWFTLVSQRPNKPEANIANDDSEAIIEIPEAAFEAVEPLEVADATKVVNEPTEEPTESTPSEPPSEMAVNDDDSLAQKSTSKNDPPTKEHSSRNVRTPRALLEVDSAEWETSTTPRALSESMKAKSEETPAKRSIKSSYEDMRDYLAQEEPSPDSVRNSINDQMQGVDADRAAKPDISGVPEDRIRSSSKSLAITDKPKASISVPMQQRLARVHGCLDYYLKNPETTTARSPWAVMHAILAFGADYELIGPNGRVNAIGWMCHNGLCRTQRIFTPRGDFFVPNVGGGVQGHEGQFLAILAQCQVPLDYPIQIGSRKFTVEDLVRYEMATCKEKSELTFKLIGLSYYVDADKQWRSNDGKVWNLEKLLREELAQPVVGSACGGTHRLMGLSFCVRQRELQGLPINGQFARAAKFINEYVRYTWQLQNPDGSFSTNWYVGRGNEPNDERKVQTSGHMLEWLMFTVSDEELTSSRVEKAVDFLLSKIYDLRETKWPIGPRGHATRALALYNLRMEALLEQRAGVPANSLAKERVHGEDAAKTSSSPAQTPVVRQGQTSPAGAPASQPASRSTGRPTRRVRG